MTDLTNLSTAELQLPELLEISASAFTEILPILPAARIVEMLDDMRPYHPTKREAIVREAARRLRELTEWHPASEVPEHEGTYLVVADTVLGQGRLYATAHFNGKWHSYVSNIRAWRDLPEWREPEDAS